MASRIIHTAIASLVEKSYPIRDRDRFFLGVILPDAYAEGSSTAESHLKISVFDGTKKTYDLDRFRSLFSEELKTDDLYRGYYLHLIQDIYFRDFVYHRYHWDPAPLGNVEKLHRDYVLTNPYVIQKYDLEYHLHLPKDIESERIELLYPFDLDRLQRDFHSDFEARPDGECFFFTNEMADEFITLAYDHSVEELTALDAGEIHTDMLRMAWERNIIKP